MTDQVIEISKEQLMSPVSPVLALKVIQYGNSNLQYNMSMLVSRALKLSFYFSPDSSKVKISRSRYHILRTNTNASSNKHFYSYTN